MNNQYVGWTIDDRSKKGHLKLTPYCCTLHAYLRSAYVCAWIVLSNIRRWTSLWSRAVLHSWLTMDGARRQFDGTLQMVSHLHSMGGPFPRTSKWAMSNIWKFSIRWGWVFLERTRILKGIHFTTYFIEIFVVETKQFVGSFVHVILTRQTCGQRSSRAAESKRRLRGKLFFRANLLYVSNIKM